MSKLMFAFVATLSLASFGCKKKGGGAAGEAVAKMEGFQKSMCDCKDKACADKVNEDMAKWGTEMAKTMGAAKDEKPDPDLAKKSADVMTKYTECMTKLMMAAIPTVPTVGDVGSAAAAAGSAAGSAATAAGSAATAADKTDAAAAGSAAAAAGSAAGSAAAAAGSAVKEEIKKDVPKKDGPKKDDKKPDDKAAGGW